MKTELLLIHAKVSLILYALHLMRLHTNGYTITVASSKGKTALLELLQVLGIARYITHVYGEQDVSN